VSFDRRHRNTQVGRDFLVRRSIGQCRSTWISRDVNVSTYDGLTDSTGVAGSEAIAVPVRENRSIAATFSPCSLPAIEFSLTTRNSACGIPAATSWHSSNDANGNDGS